MIKRGDIVRMKCAGVPNSVGLVLDVDETRARPYKVTCCCHYIRAYVMRNNNILQSDRYANVSKISLDDISLKQRELIFSVLDPQDVVRQRLSERE